MRHGFEDCAAALGGFARVVVIFFFFFRLGHIFAFLHVFAEVIVIKLIVYTATGEWAFKMNPLMYSM